MPRHKTETATITWHRCLEYAQKMGAHIALNAYGSVLANSKALQAAVDMAQLVGQLFVSASGRSIDNDTHFCCI